jgi:hypothetical protein
VLGEGRKQQGSATSERKTYIRLTDTTEADQESWQEVALSQSARKKFAFLFERMILEWEGQFVNARGRWKKRGSEARKQSGSSNLKVAKDMHKAL